jgi:hypothetical protein
MENIIVKKLQRQIGGVREIKSSLGYIDLLTKNQVIEVKNAQRFLQALRQVLCYSKDFPELEKRIHLFGNNAKYYQEKAKKLCEKNKYDVVVTIDEV